MYFIRKITPEYRIEFDKKIKKFRNRDNMMIYEENFKIYIDRKKLFSDAYDHIMNTSPIELKKRLRIKYIGEESIDAGGLLR